MMKKALLVATIGYFFSQFEMHDIEILRELGYEVHCAADFTVPISEKRRRELKASEVIIHQIDFSREPMQLSKHLKAYHQLNAVIRGERISLIHCHTPVAGAIARLSAHHCGVKNVVYTAHGFHFFQGAPLKNWLIYYPIEKFLSRLTKVQITINQEDYEIAKARFHAREIQYVPGVGITLSYNETEKELEKRAVRSLDEKHSRPDVKKIRKLLGVKENEYMVVSVGELIDRKNHSMVIQALAEHRVLPVQYFILGRGINEGRYRDLIRNLHMEDRIHLLGYRDDVEAIDRAADLFVFPSFQEGLPLALMEAMREDTPVIVSDIRGNRELILNPDRLFDPKNQKEFVECLQCALKSLTENGMTEDILTNRKNLKNFSRENVELKMKQIYSSIEGEA